MRNQNSKLSSTVSNFYQKEAEAHSTAVTAEMPQNTSDSIITYVIDETFTDFRYRFGTLIVLHTALNCPASQSAMRKAKNLLTQYPQAKFIEVNYFSTPQITLAAGGISKPGSVSIWKESKPIGAFSFRDYKHLNTILQQYV